MTALAAVLSRACTGMSNLSVGCPRPNSFDGIRLASLSCAEAPAGQRVQPTDLPSLAGVEEAQQSLRDAPDQPFVLRGAVRDWPAVNWSVEQLKHDHGHVPVPVERSCGGADYRDMYAPRSPAASPRSFNPGAMVPWGQLLDHVQHHTDDRKSPTMALAQTDLFEHIPDLRAGVAQPPFPEAMERLHACNAWMGPAGTMTPCHRDPYFNFLCQVWGEKQVQLFSTDYSQHLYPFSTPFLRNTSQVDVAAVDGARFPLFLRVPSQQVLLRPGDLLYIPQRYWHLVTARTASFSVNYWFT